MTRASEHMVEQRILEHEARLKHMNEMLERVDAGVAESDDPAEIREELKDLHAARDDLAQHVEEIKKMSREAQHQQVLEEQGPMMMWDAVAAKLESLVERIGR